MQPHETLELNLLTSAVILSNNFHGQVTKTHEQCRKHTYVKILKKSKPHITKGVYHIKWNGITKRNLKQNSKRKQPENQAKIEPNKLSHLQPNRNKT
jgi:hypothetical protein